MAGSAKQHSAAKGINALRDNFTDPENYRKLMSELQELVADVDVDNSSDVEAATDSDNLGGAGSEDENASNAESDQAPIKDLSEGELTRRLTSHIPASQPLEYSERLIDDSDGGVKIRVLNLSPGEPDDPLEGELEVVVLDTAPEFDALSYCWGVPEPKYPINVSGTIFQATISLKLALYQLRKKDSSRRIWIDAICINQSDNDEKSFQVGQMRDIYVKAQQTIVWLGEEENKSFLALQMCSRLYNEYAVTYLQQELGGKDAEAFALMKELSLRATGDGEFNISKAIHDYSFEVGMRMASGEKYDGPYKELFAGIMDEDDDENEDKDEADNDRASATGNQTLPTSTFNSKVIAQFASGFKTAGNKETKTNVNNEGSEDVKQDQESDGKRNDDALAPTELDSTEGGDNNNDNDDDDDAQNIDDEDDDNSTENSDNRSDDDDDDDDDDNSEEESDDSDNEDSDENESDDEDTGDESDDNSDGEENDASNEGSVTDTANQGQPTSEEILAFHALLDRPWFRRIWIVQEVSVSEDVIVQCGSQSIGWWVFVLGFAITLNIHRISGRGPSYHRNVDLMSSTRLSLHAPPAQAAADHELQLLSLMVKYRRYLATNANDKIFALFGLTTTDLGKLKLAPDYSKSMQDVYLSVATALIEESTSLEMLSIPAARDENEHTLPSWVPRWDLTGPQRQMLAGDRNNTGLRPTADGLRVFSASSDSQASPKVLEDNCLSLQGYFTDTIKDVSRALSVDENIVKQPINWAGSDLMGDPAATLSSMQDFFGMMKAFPSVIDEWKGFAKLEDDPAGFQEFALTLWTDLDSENAVEECRTWLAQMDNVKSLIKELPSFDIEPTEENIMSTIMEMVPVMIGLDPETFQFQQTLQCIHILDRSLARTATGKLCLVPPDVMVGDRICLLRGSTTPHVLRAKGKDHEHIGEAFVRGMMYGEAWHDDKCREIRLC